MKFYTPNLTSYMLSTLYPRNRIFAILKSRDVAPEKPIDGPEMLVKLVMWREGDLPINWNQDLVPPTDCLGQVCSSPD